MVVDLGACTGCGACGVACRQENNVPDVDERTWRNGRQRDWLQLVTKVEGRYHDAQVESYPLMCLHCDDAPCTKVCPVGATYSDEEGLVAQIYDRCIGCRYCTNACPYSVKTFNWLDPVWPQGTERRQNPDVSVRPRGVVEKCTMCHHRHQKADDRARFEGRELRHGDYTPACVEICPAGAMIFGDLDDPESEVSKRSEDKRAYRLMEELGTEPKVVFLRPHGKRS